MESSDQKRSQANGRSFVLRAMLVIFDIIAVNLAYFAALTIRFYVNYEFNEWALVYIPAFIKLAPGYTLFCLVVFGVFKLYNSRWRYAGLGDLNRILMASLVTCVGQVLGSLIFTMRMPITYYVIGAVLQFAMVAVSRFSYRITLLEMERARARKRRSGTMVNVMVVGVGETAHTMLRHMERDPESAARPVCLVDFRADGYGSMMEGLPVIGGTEKIRDTIKKYGVECVILADTTMPAQIRQDIRELCKDLEVDVQDYAGYFQESRGTVTLRGLMGYAKGPLEIVLNGVHQKFENGEQAALFLTERYVVTSVSAKDGYLVVELKKDALLPNDVKEDWVQSYEKESGEDISFF